MAKEIIVKKVKSHIGTKPKQQKTLRALGLRKMNSERVHQDNPVIRGMIYIVHHLVEVREK